MKDIIIKNINKSFGEKTVLIDYSTVISSNRITCVMGSSGCGKTTLFNILMGIEKADSGTIENVPKRISVVFQEDRLCDEFSSVKNIELVTGKNVPNEKIRALLIEAGLSGSMDIPVKELSGGMKRRVAIIRALLYESELLLLDEPFKGLDEQTKKTICNIVKKYSKGRTVIVITHDYEDIALLDAELIRM